MFPDNDTVEQVMFDIIVSVCHYCDMADKNTSECKKCFVKWCDDRFDALAGSGIGSPRKHVENMDMFKSSVLGDAE